MKRILTLSMVATVAASAALAQSTTTQAVLGASDDPVYSVQVQGADGVTYNCKPGSVTIDGVASRVCVKAGSGGGDIFGDGLTEAQAAGLGLVTLVAVAALGGGGGSTNTTTSTN